MSAVPVAAGGAVGTLAPAVATERPRSPMQRAWARFRRNRLGTISLAIFVAMLVVSAMAELLSNDKPLLARYDGRLFFPLFHNPPEASFGGDFHTPTDWRDPFIEEQFAKPGNWRLHTLNRHSATSTDYFQNAPNPAAPSAKPA